MQGYSRPTLLDPVRVAAAMAQLHRRFSRRRAAARVFAFGEAALIESLRPDEKTAVTRHIYDQCGGGAKPHGLQPWERSWFKRRLPPPPATILVGGAGAGRELLALGDLGYALYAFEPASTLVAEARAACAERAEIWDLDYAAFVAAVARRDHPLCRHRYDAVLLGWGSLSHVLEPAGRTALLRACRDLCPSGPILASFQAAERRGRSRIAWLGRRVGRPIGIGRGVASAPITQQFWCHSGFFDRLDRAHVAELATAARSRVAWEDDASYAHVTFLHSEAA